MPRMTALKMLDNPAKATTTKQATMPFKADFVISKYIRLSMDDGISESLSIPYQHMILDAHMDELEIPNATVIEFVGNGYTGTNMERPQLQEMLDLVRCGRVHCIVVKGFFEIFSERIGKWL